MKSPRALSCLVLSLALWPGSARSGRLPAAGEVATRIGQEVEFEDVITAVAHSRSKTGRYFSFGAPYPKQALSVWVLDDIYDQLPHDPGLIGRRVRIKGKLESSPTGPMVTLASPDEFDLVEVDDALVAKPFLDGRIDREHFMAAVAQAFWREDFTKLEQLVKDLQESRERFSDGTWIENAFFIALEVAEDESNERYAEAGGKIDRWLAHHPGSAAATIAQAGYHINLAAHARGARSGSETPEGRAEFKREMGVARQILEANPSAQIVPEYFVKMEKIAFAQEWTREAFFRLFAEAIAREPDYYTFYFQAAFYLLAGPGSERGGWEGFAEEQREKRGAGGGEGDALYARIAWSMSVNYPDLFGRSAISWEKMASGFDLLMKRYPNSRWLKNAYANFAWKADDRVRLRPALAAIADNPDMGIWVSLENFAIAQKFADGK